MVLLSLAVAVWLTPSILAQTVIATISVPNSPRDLAVNPTTNRIYVASASSNTVSVIDGNTGTIVATIPVSTETAGMQVNPPFGVAVNPTTNRIYVALRNSNAVAVIDGKTNTVAGTVAIEGGGPIAVAVNPTTNRVYVVNDISDTVSVIDGDTNTITASIPVGFGALHVAVNPTINRIYVANNSSNTVFVIDGNTNTVVATVPVVGPLRLEANPQTNRVYVVNAQGNTLSVIDGNTNTVVTTTQVDAGPTGVALNPTTNRIYVANNDGNTVSVIDGSTSAVVATIQIDGPIHLAVNPTTNRVFAAIDVRDTVSVIQDIVPTPAVRVLPRAGGLPMEVALLLVVALVTLGLVVRRLGAARFRLAVGLCLLLTTVGASLAMAADGPPGGTAVTSVPDKRIALTFDDGYNSRNVNLILDTLAREGVRATFFPVGIWVQRDPVTFRRIQARHEVGNHTFSHPFLTRLSNDAVRREILGGVVVPPFLFRPPYGDINARVRAIAQSLGFRVVLWDVDSRDYTGISPALVTRNVVSNAGDGKIVLMHMGDWNTVRALPQIIAELRARGFTFVTVTEL